MGIFGNLTGWHLLAIVFLVLLLFGAPKLPGLAKSLGQSMKIFQKEIKSDKGAEQADSPAADATPDSQATATTTAQSTESSPKQ